MTDFQALAKDQIRILGADHQGVLGTRNNIAQLFAQSGSIDKALTEFKALLKDQTRIFGADHPSIKVTQDWILHLREKLNPQQGGNENE